MQNKNFFTKTRWLVTIILLLSLGVSQMWGQAATETATDGKSYVVTVYYNSKYYALPNGTNAGQWAATEVSVNANGRVTTATPPMWTFTEGSTSGQFYLSYTSGNTTNYLYKNGTTNSNYNIKGGSSKNYWAFTKSSNKYNVLAVGRGTNHTRLCLYNSQLKWEVYGTSSTTYDIILLLPVQTLSTSTTSLTGFTYQEGSGPSAAQSFSVSGSYLTANITVTAPTNYEVSKSSGSGYASSVTFTQSSGSVSAQTVYVRLKSGLSAGTYNGSSITISSTGATNKTISLSGSVTASCSADPTIGDASINSSFTLTSLIGAVAVSGNVNPGTNCEWTDMGLVWGASSNPTTSNNKKQISSSGSVKSFSNNVQPSESTNPTAWVVGVTYYVRIYGKNGKAGAAYNYSTNDASFTLRSITYNSNGGSDVNTQYVNSGGTYSAPTDPTKTGYTFGGWYTDDGTFANAMDWSSAITANKELYAKWTANSYTVAFNANGGSGSAMANQSFDYDETKALSANTYEAPAHKYFLGWNTNSAATTATYTDGQSVSNLAATDGATVTLYAIWKEHTYTNYRTNCCEKPTITINGTGKTVEEGKIVFPLLREDLGGAATTTWATLDITFSSNSAGAFTVITNSSKTAAKLSTWQSRATTGGTWANVSNHAKFEITSAGNARFSVKTADGYTGQGTYRIGLHQDANGDNCAMDVYIFVDVTLRDKFVDQLNDNGTVNRDGHGAQLATPTLSQLPSQDEDACHDEERKLKGWIKETDLKAQYETGNSTRVQSIDGLCESCDPASDQKSLVVAPGDNITTSGATWYAVWAYER